MKALVLYIEISNGFKSPAVAIAKELKKRGVQVELSDMYSDLGFKKYDFFLKAGWRYFLKYPFLFSILYKFTEFCPRFYEETVFFFTRKKIKDQLDKIKPDFVVSTHFITTYALANLIERNNLKIPMFGYNSDVVVAHKYWIQNNLCRNYVSTKDGYNDMIKKGQKKDVLELTSFPLDSKFRKKFKSVSFERKKLGLKDKFTGVVVFGGEGIWNPFSFLEKIQEKKVDIQLIIVCGKNKSLFDKLNELKKKNPNLDIVVLGFVDNLQDYQYCADISMGKSGLNYVFESLFMENPFMVLTAQINESFVADYIIKNKFGWWPKTEEEAAATLEKIAKNKNQIQKLKSNIRKKKIKFNTEEIANSIIKKTKEYFSHK